MRGSAVAAGTHRPTSGDPLEVIDGAFARAIEPWRRSSSPATVLFSGGVDSGVIAWELRARASTSLLTVGRPGSADLLAASATASTIGLPWTAFAAAPDELESVLARAAPELEGAPMPARGIFVSLAVAFARSASRDVICGQGADELFLGYAHFAGLSPDAAEERSAADLDRLLRDDWPRTIRLAERFGRTVHAPLLDPEFRRAIASIPIAERMPHPVPKALWRRWAKRRGLPAELADRPKRAVQFGTGIAAWLRRRGDR